VEIKMKVLFVSGGNSTNFSVNPFIKNQGDSLQEYDVEVSYFTIKGKGIMGYLKNSKAIRCYLKNSPFDLIHAHYTLSAWCAILSFSGKPIVLSLMGSDAYGDYIGEKKIKKSSIYLIVLTYLIQPFVKAIICKSDFIKSFVYLKRKAEIIPNGIHLERIPIAAQDYKNELGLNLAKKYVLFLGNTSDKRKNFLLVEKAINLLKNNNIEVLAPYPIAHEMVFKYYNSVNVLVVPSFMEGSPNIVKEAMACNCPIVATDVGDVKWLFGNTPGHFIARFDAEDFAQKILLAIEFSETSVKTSGRERIIELGLDSSIVAGKIVNIYKKTIVK